MMSMYALESLHNVVLKVYDILEKECPTVSDAAYVCQLVLQEMIEQGYTPQFREMKKKRQEIIDAKWEEHLCRKVSKVPECEASKIPSGETFVDPP